MAQLEARKSKIEGKGMFVLEPVKKGHFVSFLKGKIKVKENKNLKDALGNSYWVGIDKNTWIDPAPPYRFINHSCNPSASIRGKITMIALRDLKPGEEVTLDYSLIEADPRWHLEYRCKCGEPNCRGIIRSIQSLPKDRFKAYFPTIPTYFRDLYRREILKQ